MLAFGFIWYVAFLFSTTCHEARTRWPPKSAGTTRRSGRTGSLNPVPHIQREPWGMVVFSDLSLVRDCSLFGWAARHYDRCGAAASPTGA